MKFSGNNDAKSHTSQTLTSSMIMIAVNIKWLKDDSCDGAGLLLTGDKNDNKVGCISPKNHQFAEQTPPG